MREFPNHQLVCFIFAALYNLSQARVNQRIWITDLSIHAELARVIPVSSITNAPSAALRLIISDTPIRLGASEESDWNSQNWVGEALDRLVVAGYLDAEAKDKALDKMVDAVLEAGDEEVS